MKERKKLMVSACTECGLKHYNKDLIVIDIDGTLCKFVICRNENFLFAEPLPQRIKLVRELKAKGHNIILNTGRPESGRNQTEEWLRKHNVPYDLLCMEKSGYAFVLDDAPVLTTWFPMSRDNNDEHVREWLL